LSNPPVARGDDRYADTLGALLWSSEATRTMVISPGGEVDVRKRLQRIQQRAAAAAAKANGGIGNF
jgi:hypothetical protein